MVNTMIADDWKLLWRTPNNGMQLGSAIIEFAKTFWEESRTVEQTAAYGEFDAVFTLVDGTHVYRIAPSRDRQFLEVFEQRPELEVGDAVEIVDAFNGGEPHVVCAGNIERITKTLIIVRNEHGNESRFRKNDRKMVGYAWPQLTHELRRKKEDVA
jgi:hypothetical protein